MDTAEDLLADLTDFPDAPDLPDSPDEETWDPAEEDMACGDGLENCGGECVETMVDIGNCGGCGIRCEARHTTEECMAGVCEIVDCEDGWHDWNGDVSDGCEWECTATGYESSGDGTCSDGMDNDCDMRIDDDDLDCTCCCVEWCNELDDDCDTLTDEDFDLDTDPLNCGACSVVCGDSPHASPGCISGECAPICDAGWADVDHDPGNGCETGCAPAPDAGETDCEGIDP